jgi:hypothetical protein
MDGNAEIDKPKSAVRPIVVAAVGLAALLATVLWMWRTLGPGLPQIQPADLAPARAKWQAHEVRNYDVTIVLSGRQTGTLRLEIRDGEPRSLTRNGTAMKQERTWQPWTVPGMFDTLETDFDNAAHPAEKYGSADVRVVLRAKFDETYGYPRRYLQQIYGRLDDLSWEVTEFVVR